MDISVPEWRRRARWPDTLLKLAFYVLATFSALLFALAFYLGEVSDLTLGESTNLLLRKLSGVLIALLLAVIATSWVVRRSEHAKANGLINELFGAAGVAALPAGEPVVLYLRSFRAARGYAWRRLVRFLLSRGAELDPARDLESAFGNRCTFVAIGDKHNERAALKIRTSDAHWEQVFRDLAERASLIVCFTGPTPASLLEIQTILVDDRLYRKTMFLLPPNIGTKFYETMRAHFAERGARLPHYAVDGMFFRPPRGLVSMEAADYKKTLAVIAKADLGHPRIADDVWKESIYRQVDAPSRAADPPLG